MSEQDLLRVRNWVKAGARLMIGSDPLGRRKIKVVRGPFGMLTRRFECSEADITRLRQLLSKPETGAAA